MLGIDAAEPLSLNFVPPTFAGFPTDACAFAISLRIVEGTDYYFSHAIIVDVPTRRVLFQASVASRLHLCLCLCFCFFFSKIAIQI